LPAAVKRQPYSWKLESSTGYTLLI
jgi:hypothetical protein